MPKIMVNGISIAYEILGEGPPIVFTPGGFYTPKESMRWIAGRMSLVNQTLIYDRRNCGESDAQFENSESEVHLYASDLKALLESLEMTPAYLYGASGGLIISLLTAYYYPECVKGLLLQSVPSDNIDLWKLMTKGYYIETAELAESKGMSAVLKFSNDWVNWSDRFKPNSKGEQQFLVADPVEFAVIMRKWSKFLISGRAQFGGLLDEEISQIQTPTIIIPGNDDFHLPEASEELHNLIPNSDLFSHDKHFTTPELEQLRDLTEDWRDGREAATFAPFLNEFVQKVEIPEY